MTLALFVVPLGFDTLAVAIALGVRGTAPLRPALVFALFEALMPLIGLVLGRVAGARFATPAAVVGGLVLLAVAASVFKEALENEDEAASLSFGSLRTAVLAGLGISMDELAVGFPMGTSGLPVPQTIAAIALQAFVVTYAGIALGARIGAAFGRRASRGAGFIAAGAFALLGLYLIAQRLLPALPEV
ncbi:MAG: manganese efflux pump family protein [Candidatus Eremiobacteraeota bacterium]|nr:manganese efflux pump family protein [Candidatus Eremiobacteraeota bacterium]